jgi:hypothetical protein
MRLPATVNRCRAARPGIMADYRVLAGDSRACRVYRAASHAGRP